MSRTNETPPPHQPNKQPETTSQIGENNAKAEPKKENFFLNLALNIIIPTIILTKFSSEKYLGPQLGVLVALAFPIAYGVADFFRARKVNFFSALGVLSVLLTGGISILELDPKYIAIKEAAIPAIFGLVVLVSLRTRYPLVRTFLFNDKIMQVDKVTNALNSSNNTQKFEQVLKNASLLIACSFFLSSFLNYTLAKIVVKSQPGTEAFAAELGKMTALSYPVIMAPTMAVFIFALFYMFRRIMSLTGLGFEEIMNVENEKK